MAICTSLLGTETNLKDIQEHYNPGLARRIDEAKQALSVLQKQLRTLRKQKTSADNAVLETYAKVATRKAEIAAWDCEEEAKINQRQETTRHDMPVTNPSHQPLHRPGTGAHCVFYP